jgi:hypothetical protein
MNRWSDLPGSIDGGLGRLAAIGGRQRTNRQIGSETPAVPDRLIHHTGAQ